MIGWIKLCKILASMEEGEDALIYAVYIVKEGVEGGGNNLVNCSGCC